MPRIRKSVGTLENFGMSTNPLKRIMEAEIKRIENVAH